VANTPVPHSNVPIADPGTGLPTIAWFDVLKQIDTLQPLSAIVFPSDATKSNVTRTINAQSGTSYIFVLTDAGNLCEFTNGSAVSVTIPPNSSVAFPVGTQIDLMAGGAGKVTFAAGVGVTLKSFNSWKSLAGQEAAGTLVQMAANVWRLAGSLVA
jgi:hypothetical protein